MLVLSSGGCGKSPVHLTASAQDTIDRDFTVLVTSTKDPLVFNVEVKKANPKVDKQFGAFAVLVDFVLMDASKHVFRARPGVNQGYAESVNKSFEVFSPKAGPIKGRVKLLKNGLHKGNYVVQAVARIWETGKDAVSGHLYADRGSVAVPSGNSVKITIK